MQLARQATDSKAGSLLHDLFSTQEDQLAASASQRFLLSSLVTNLQDEVEQKNAIVANLKRQVEQARAEAREIEQLAVAWERRAQTGTSAQTRSPTEAKKLAALEETVRLLADELETRMREDRSRRRKLEKELERTRADFVHAVNEHREIAIRLKHVSAANTQSDEARATAQAACAEEEARRREAERERDELRARWQIDANERDRVVALLREEVTSLRSSAPTSKTDEHLEREVQRRVELATQASTRDVQLAQHELMQRDAALEELRQELQASRDEAARLTRSVQEERQHAELANADLEGLLAAKEHEVAELAQSRSDAQEELDDALTRLDAAESERDQLAATLSSKEGEFAQQTEQTRAALAAMAELESAVARVERDLTNKEGELEQVRSDLASQRRESDNVLEKRDRVLAEAEREAGRLRKDLEATRGENARLSELVGKLRLDSADREGEFCFELIRMHLVSLILTRTLRTCSQDCQAQEACGRTRGGCIWPQHRPRCAQSLHSLDLSEPPSLTISSALSRPSSKRRLTGNGRCRNSSSKRMDRLQTRTAQFHLQLRAKRWQQPFLHPRRPPQQRLRRLALDANPTPRPHSPLKRFDCAGTWTTTWQRRRRIRQRTTLNRTT